MRTHVDWITFTISMVYKSTEEDDYANAIQNGLMDLFPADLVKAVFGGAWTHEKRSRAPYKDTWMDADAGISVYASPNLTHASVEITGSGCEQLLAMGTLAPILERCYERVTRIDIATDIETSTTPTEFCFFTSHDRMRATGFQKSKTGETHYVGSKKSDRYARVYRYFEPHPRSHLLRIEHVFRKDYAKAVAKSLLGAQLEDVAAAAGRAFGWSHADWQVSATQDVDISITAPERGQSATVSWLLRSVAPCIKRLIADGTIKDADTFFDMYFKP